MAPSEAARNRAPQLAERLARQPDAVQTQVEAMPDEIENRTGALTTVDAAEDALVARVRQLGQAGLTAWVQQHCAQLNATPPPGARTGPQKKLRWLSTFGAVAVLEPSWRRGPVHLRPFATQARVRCRGCSRRLQRALTDFGADEAFAPAAAKVREHYGVAVTPERVRQVCLTHAGRLVETAPPACTTLRAHGPAHLVAEADGTMLPIVDTSSAPAGADKRQHRRVRWQEARVVAAQAHGATTTHYDATLGDVAEAGARWSRAAGAAGRGVNTRIHAVGDGAPGSPTKPAVRFGAAGTYLLDLYHVCAYLAAVWPGDKATFHRHRDALKAGRTDAVLTALRDRLEPPDTPEAAAPARRALRYLENRRAQLDYPAALAAGLPVGSGLSESAHRHLLQARLKLAGAWWTQPHAHAMTQLRVCRANLRWDAYWQKN